jgi:hypothetical protein
MQLDLKNVRVTYTIKEVILVLCFLSGLVGHVIRTELQDADLKTQMVDVRKQLADCKDKLAVRASGGMR